MPNAAKKRVMKKSRMYLIFPGREKNTYIWGAGIISLPFKFLMLDHDVHPKDSPRILYGPSALSKVFHQNGPFPPIRAFLPPTAPTCLARVSRQNQVPHQSWPQKMSSSTETCTYNDAEQPRFFFVTFSPRKKNKKTCSTPLALPLHPFFSKPIFHTTFNQSPLNSALYGKVAKATPAIKAASSIPTPTHGNWAVTPMKKHQDKDNTNMSSTPTGFLHTNAIRC